MLDQWLGNPFLRYLIISKFVKRFPKFMTPYLGGSSPNDLRYVQVPAITNAQCNQAYNGDITSSMICAGYPGTGGKDACQGDSGGPFVCNQGGKAIIAGVVSWGYGCAAADFPGVYARNTAALSWIQANMGNCGNSPSPPPPSPSLTFTKPFAFPKCLWIPRLARRQLLRWWKQQCWMQLGWRYFLCTSFSMQKWFHWFFIIFL